MKVIKNYQEQLGRGTKEEGNHRCKEGKRGWNERFEAFWISSRELAHKLPTLKQLRKIPNTTLTKLLNQISPVTSFRSNSLIILFCAALSEWVTRNEVVVCSSTPFFTTCFFADLKNSCDMNMNSAVFVFPLSTSHSSVSQQQHYLFILFYFFGSEKNNTAALFSTQWWDKAKFFLS